MTRQIIIFPLLVFLALGPGCAGKNQRWSPPDQDAGAPESAEELAKRVSRASTLTRDAQRNELAGNQDRAIELYKAAIAEYRETPVAWHNLAILLSKKGENLAAREAFVTASELSPTDPRPLYGLGVLYEDLGYLDDAAKWYDESLQRDPAYQPALRRAVLVDDLRGKLSQTTAERTKRAILAEREPWWINRFKRIQQRLRDRNSRYPSGESETMPAAPLPAPTTPITVPDSLLTPSEAPAAPSAPTGKY